MPGSHLVPIGHDGWSLWKWFWLRGAGFPAAMVLELGSSDLVPVLDELHAADAALKLTKERILAACERASQATELALTRAANDITSRLARGKLPLNVVGDPELENQRQSLLAHVDAASVARSSALELLAREQLRVSRALIDDCNMPQFREALAWQNRSALRNSVDRLAQTPPDEDNGKARERKRLVARYIQRYALKNDTIGFFGPVFWCRFDRELDGVDLLVGPLVTRRWAAFEEWTVGALAEMMSFSPELFPICALRLKPFSWIEANRLHRPPAEPKPLSDAEVLLLELGRDTQTIDQIVTGALAHRSGVITSREQGLEVARNLVHTGVAISQIEIPAEVAHKERHLRALLLAAPGGEARTEAMSNLDTLSEDRRGLDRSAGDPVALDAAIDQLEVRFTQITSRAAKRGHGQVYAGRQIFFEDCLRGGELTVGRTVLDAIGDPLSLMLLSARWYTFEVARRYRAAFTARHAELVRKTGEPRAPLGAFLLATADLFAHQRRGTAPIVAEVREELRRRWDQIIAFDADARRVDVRSETCRDKVHELFGAPHPGWPTARYQAPDLMIAASTPEGIAAGEFVVVLGELHAGVNTLLARCAFDEHPERDAALRACEEDIGSVCIAPVQPVADRTSTIVWTENAFHVELAQARSWRARGHVLAGGDLYVIEDAGVLTVRSRTRDVSFDIIRFMDHYLSAEASPHFRVFRDAKHMPRVTLDRLVISRERWSLAREDFSMLVSETATREDQFLLVQAWIARLGLPRFVFAVVPEEAKPFYVDFTSPIYVDMFLKFIARATNLKLSEMLPAHGEQWLSSDDGRRYTSELRIAAVDPVPWSADTASSPR